MCSIWWSRTFLCVVCRSTFSRCFQCLWGLMVVPGWSTCEFFFSSFLVECSTGNSSNFQALWSFSFFSVRKTQSSNPQSKTLRNSAKILRVGPENWLWRSGLIPTPYPNVPWLLASHLNTDHSTLTGKMLFIRTESAGVCRLRTRGMLVGRGLI